LRTYGSLENTVFVVDQGEALRLFALLRGVRRRPSNRLIVVVHHLREGFRYRNPLYVRMATWNETAMLRLAHRVVVHTRDTAREVAERGVPESRITVIPLGTRRNGSAIQVRRLDAEEPLRLLWVGGDFARKGFFPFLKALEKVPEPRPVVTVVGQPLEESDLIAARAEAKKRGVDPSIRFLGFIPPDHFEHLWQEHDAYVLPSLHEGHGLALDEALARGMPALLSDLPVFLERLPADHAVYVPRADTEALASGMVALRDHALRERLSRLGLVRAQSFPDWADTLSAYDAVLRREIAALSFSS
jgi:glycosyltransferase involved in cell wall biosynthesis